MTIHHPAPSLRPLGPILVISLLLIMLIAGLAWAHVVGRKGLAAVEQAELIEIARETQEFCAGLGLKKQAGDYARCVSGLAEIRRKQKERWDAVTAGLM
jgi:hypothetical protein